MYFLPLCLCTVQLNYPVHVIGPGYMIPTSDHVLMFTFLGCTCTAGYDACWPLVGLIWDMERGAWEGELMALQYSSCSFRSDGVRAPDLPVLGDRLRACESTAFALRWNLAHSEDQSITRHESGVVGSNSFKFKSLVWTLDRGNFKFRSVILKGVPVAIKEDMASISNGSLFWNSPLICAADPNNASPTP